MHTKKAVTKDFVVFFEDQEGKTKFHFEPDVSNLWRRTQKLKEARCKNITVYISLNDDQNPIP